MNQPGENVVNEPSDPSAESPPTDRPLLTVIIPAYNEALTLARVLDAVSASPIDHRIVVVDDGSDDETPRVIDDWRRTRGIPIEVIRHERNMGKGSAIRSALPLADGLLTIVQDADLEVDPGEYPALIEPIVQGRAQVVYGSRYLNSSNHLGYSPHRFGVMVLNALVFALYGRRISDEATCYKAAPTELLRSLDLRCRGFEFCPETTAKLCRMGMDIHEIPIRYNPRTVAEGKKLRLRDGALAIWTLIYWRFAPFQPGIYMNDPDFFRSAEPHASSAATDGDGDKTSARSDDSNSLLDVASERSVSESTPPTQPPGPSTTISDDRSTEPESIGRFELTRFRVRCAVAALMSIHSVLLFIGLWMNSVVIDEVAHVPSGFAHWRTGSFAPDRVNPPLARLIAVLPAFLARPICDESKLNEESWARSEWQIGPDFIKANGPRTFLIFRLSRLTGILWSLLGGWIVFRWARELYGSAAGLLSLTLWCFEPTILAFAPVVTPDLPTSTIAIVSTYLFSKFLKEPSWDRAYFSGIVLGLAQLTKYTLLVFYLVWPLLWVVSAIDRARRGMRIAIKREIAQGIFIVATSVLIINLGYLLQGTFQQLKDYQFVSRVLAGPSPYNTRRLGDGLTSNRFKESLPGKLPVPLPADYVGGIDLQRLDFEKFFPSYLNGVWRIRGWWYFYLYAIWIKIPLGIQALVLWGLTALCFDAFRGRFRLDDAVLAISGGSLLAFVSSQTGFSHHMRYVMPMFPFALVIAGRPAVGLFSKSFGKIAAIAISAFTGWAVISSLAIAPHWMSYFNEVGGGPLNGHKHLLMSNIDWGQDLLFLKAWYDKHPEARPLKLAFNGSVDPRFAGIEFGVPAPNPNGLFEDDRAYRGKFGPFPGYYAISVSYLHGGFGAIPNGKGGWKMLMDDHEFDYFNRFRPIGRAGYSIYLYHITKEQAEAARRELGLPPLAESVDLTNGDSR